MKWFFSDFLGTTKDSIYPWGRGSSTEVVPWSLYPGPPGSTVVHNPLCPVLFDPECSHLVFPPFSLLLYLCPCEGRPVLSGLHVPVFHGNPFHICTKVSRKNTTYKHFIRTDGLKEDLSWHGRMRRTVAFRRSLEWTLWSVVFQTWHPTWTLRRQRH